MSEWFKESLFELILMQTIKAVARMGSVKKVFLKISEN